MGPDRKLRHLWAGIIATQQRDCRRAKMRDLDGQVEVAQMVTPARKPPASGRIDR